VPNRRLTGEPVHPRTLLNTSHLGEAGQEVTARLSALAMQLAVPAREWFLAEMVRIGLADGPLTEDERQAALEIAAGLAMTHAQAVGVIALTEQGASAG